MSSSQLHFGAWQVLYSVDFLCLSAANLMVLDRMRDFSGLGKYKFSTIIRWLTPAVVMSGCGGIRRTSKIKTLNPLSQVVLRGGAVALLLQ